MNRRAFTLIELLMVVGIISLLAVSVFVALNPAKRLLDTKNARRTTDVGTILTAVHQSIVDDKGTLPTNLAAAGTTERQLGTDASGCAIATAGCAVTNAVCLDLMTGTENLATYLSAMTIDPNGSPTYTAGKTGYSVQVNANGIVTVRSCGAEGGVIISASR